MSENLTAVALAVIVEQMRHAQKSYFTAIAKAKKTKLPEDFATANIILKNSKEQELIVDNTIKMFLMTNVEVKS